MNFLSHYYFDRDVTDCYSVLGAVLPDLLKNADKTIVLHPEKLIHTDSNVNAIIKGWNKHLDVDRHFHSSEFFKTHSHQLKKDLLPAIAGSVVKPFFLGHIAVELILDNLLITTQQIIIDDFYDHLQNCSETVIQEFFAVSGLQNTDAFFSFFKKFKKNRYLETYAETPQIAYALKRICMRVWENPFTDKQQNDMNEVLANYRALLLPNFLLIFNEIGAKCDSDLL